MYINIAYILYIYICIYIYTRISMLCVYIIVLYIYIYTHHLNRCNTSAFSRGPLGNIAVSGQRRRCENVPASLYTYSPAPGRI